MLTVVLRYLNNTASRFQTFVANWLELLHSLTSSRQWNYVPTAQNPADLASCGVSPEKFREADIWFRGPSFLYEHDSQWPKQPDFLKDFKEDEPEVKKIKVCATSTISHKMTLCTGWSGATQALSIFRGQ